ncbi:TonB-dependent receptor [Phaeodactylibacter sp.]|uniref:TonB-dependent receptor n=1 Tax=Phaeodactylibacter sp. TaxID=1940289 RepID=UPI0025DC10A0|nr:TonB-dependent receptor [Phaeodactylibacter sp.]MCI4650610.1 TonB-dependent receptor [Phaeodactylibacter sp.]MCI5091375.1 TonB-dependent receptor [Phaeodactylibacter sp.]
MNRWVGFCMSFMLFSAMSGYAQNSQVSGIIKTNGEPLPGVQVLLLGTSNGTIADEYGNYQLADLPAGPARLRFSYLGYRSKEVELLVEKGQNQSLSVELERDVLRLEDIVVTATRNGVPAHRAPVMVNRIDDRIFEQTQSLSLSEGLSFSPGLRLENNCQNCGFTQLRMNGLDGPYTQILINSRPVFSALAGVYGLEMIPSNMVDRVEVVRGGGSALYGGNAIAGTVNIITKDPTDNTFEAGTNLSLINGETPEYTLSANGTIVDEQLKKGMSFFAFNRNRDPWDANGDGFSEITQLQNTTFGFDAFYNPTELSKIKANLFNISEFRRGGNQFDLPPHQTDITEQLDHRILGGGLSYEQFSKDKRHKVALYGSATHVNRQSYYGGGGRVLGPQDTLTESDILALNAYGESQDLSLASGLQYTYNISSEWLLTTGTEYQYNDVLDAMPGYNREIDQQVRTWGTYAQVEWKPTDKWSLLAGGRFDNLRVDGMYRLDVEDLSTDQDFNIFVPRATAMYFINPELKLRLSYAQGYRAPQAFDEDLHIETVGGAALFTRLSPDLKEERSHSYSAALDYTYRSGSFESNFVVDGFFTRLDNPFITANATELPSGVAAVTKRNGDGATVAGANFEANFAFGSRWMLQMGGTLQTAQYDRAEEIWAPEVLTDANQDSVVTSENLLRTPTAYGYFMTNYSPIAPLQLSLSGVFTGTMDVPHIIDPETEFTVLESPPSFFELNSKVTYELKLDDRFHLDIFGGVQNIFNSFQEDFDRGADRDAGYVYGPVRPRTFFAGVKVHFE